MHYIYFATTDQDIVTNYDISRVAYLMYGMQIYPEDHEEIRKFALTMDGICGEQHSPSVEALVANGKTVSATKVYRDIHNCTLNEAHRAVMKIAESLKGE